MARYGVSVTKSVSFRGAAQEFGNTYYYETPVPATDGVLENLLDAIVTKEKTMHSNQITFVRGKVWSAGGTNAQNTMRVQKNLSGTGAQTSTTNMDVERAILVRFRAGNDTRGNPVYLRKWWHLDVGSIASTAISDNQKRNQATLSSAQRTALETDANFFKSITSLPQNFDLVSENGRAIDGATVAHPYYEHHQLGDMWR